MIAILPTNRRRRRKLTSVLGLALDGNRLEGDLLRRTNGSIQVEKSFSVSLNLDPLTADPELVGREWRNHLDAAGIQERGCVVGLPLKWALTAQADLTNVPETEIDSFLRIEAERGFPCDVDSLQVGASRYALGAGKECALLVGVPRNHLLRLEKVLKAARLKCLSFTLPTSRPHAADLGVLSLVVGEGCVSLEVACGGGIAALRILESAVDAEAGKVRLQPSVVSREVRITLGQFPGNVQEAVRTLRVFGPRDLSQQLADELELRFEPLGFKIEVVQRYAVNQFGLQLASETPVSGATSLAAEALAGREPIFEFLPPKVSSWQRLMARQGSGKVRMAGTVAGIMVAVIAAAFGYQQWQLTFLRDKWAQMEPEVRDLETIQNQVRQFRPWFDDSFRTMHVLHSVTEAFPEDGVVSAKTIEIRNGKAVTCTGTARDNPALLKTLDRLRDSRIAADLKVDQIRGKSPMQFTFNFQWNEGGASEK